MFPSGTTAAATIICRNVVSSGTVSSVRTSSSLSSRSSSTRVGIWNGLKPNQQQQLKQQKQRPQQNSVRSKSSQAPPAEFDHVSSSVSSSFKESASASIVSTRTSSQDVVKSLVAAGAGIVTVSIAAAIVENTTAGSVPKYDPNGQRFDQSSFSGRFSKMLLACDPRLLLYTKEQVRMYQKMLEQAQDQQNLHFSRTKFVGMDDDDRNLWEARRIVESAVNDQGDWIPRPFRMSGYVPYNGPICVAMVASTTTLPLLFWSWINQSQNALVNYYNRNSTSTLTNETLLKSYGVAVGSALTVAFGLATFIQKRYEPRVAKQLLRYVAFPSSVAASSLNCYIVRSPEIDNGIPLLDEDGHEIQMTTVTEESEMDNTTYNNGSTSSSNNNNNNNLTNNETDSQNTSNIAAARGVYLTTASRAILQAPVFFLPPVVMGFLPLVKNYVSRHPSMAVPISTYMLLVSFGCGLPATVAIFPQISPIAASAVESKYHHLRNPKTNQPYDTFYYNKGL